MTLCNVTYLAVRLHVYAVCVWVCVCVCGVCVYVCDIARNFIISMSF